MRNTILWIYIALLLVGGLIGFFKAKSKISLITSVVFAAALVLCALDVLHVPHLAGSLMALLGIVFGVRLIKTKKFMPSGLMLALTALALVLRHFAE